jgi:uncharacterized protein YvpB
MKQITTILLLVIASKLAFSQDKKSKEKTELTYEVTFNGKIHTVAKGDTVQIGYGSYPNGTFMYIYTGSPPQGLDKQFAAKTATVYKVVYVKVFQQYQIYIKGRFGAFIADIPQAIDKGEIIGFNQTFFNK